MRYDKLPAGAIKYGPFVQAASQATGIPEEVIWAQMAAESNFVTDATSPRGARGLMQLMPATAAELGVDPTSPEQCIRGGAEYLRRMLVRYGGRLTHALVAYNWGPGRLGIPAKPANAWPLESQRYVTRIAKYIAMLMGA